MTENQFSKYLLYAFGEITLVAIGILIALSVNNWNDLYKTNQDTSILIKDYRADLVKDTMMLSYFIEVNESSLKSGLKNMNRISGPTATFDTIKHIAKYEHNPFISLIDKYNNKSTFNAMIGTDAFKLINPELKRSIIELDLFQTITLNEKMVDNYFALTKEFTLYYPFGDNLGSGYLNKISWNIQNERDFAVKYTSMCSFKNLLLNNKVQNYKAVIQKTKALILELDQYIPSK